MIAASPTYIERYGSPENLDDLQSTMRSATRTTAPGVPPTGFTREGKDYAMRVQETLVVDDTDSIFGARNTGTGVNSRRQLSGCAVSAQRGAGDLHGQPFLHDLPLALVCIRKTRFLLPPAVRAFMTGAKRR